MLDIIISIPGPRFLLLMIVIICVSLIVLKLTLKAVKNKSYVFPKELNYYQLALLRGGYEAVIEVILFILIENKAIAIDKNKKEKWKVIDATKAQDVIESIIVKGISCNQTNLYFDFKGFQDEMQPHFKVLEEYKLIEDNDLLRKRRIVLLITGSFILTLGIIKTFLGLSRGKPVGFLIFLMVITIVIWQSLWTKSFRVTSLGKEYLEFQYKASRYMKANLRYHTTDRMNNISVLCALYGAEAFLDVESLSGVAESLGKTRDNSGGGCSSGDYSSGDYSSGGGSSSGCSRGCGGCGGGSD